MEEALRYDPHAYGEQHTDHANNGCWVYEFPRFVWLPFAAVMYSVDNENGVVTLWSVLAV